MPTISQPISLPPSRRPFRRLVAHFASVIINTGQESGASELNLGIGGLLAILAVPGAFISIMMMDKYSSFLDWLRRRPSYDPYVVSLPDKYFFIVFAMAITGVVVAVKWDRILPDRQDYANLAPLPLAPRTIFFANLAAIVLLAAIFAIDVNAVSVVMFPMVVTAARNTFTDFLAFAAVHAITLFLASAFTFFACFAIMGTLMALLPNRLFRKVSLMVRIGLIVEFVTALFTSSAVMPHVTKLHVHPESLVRFLPPVWFLGLYQKLQGRAGPEFAILGSLAWKAAAAAFFIALASAALSYRRYFMRIPESADSGQSERGSRFGFWWAMMDRVFLTSPLQRACYRFCIRALLRSEAHSVLFGAFVGLGVLAASEMALSDSFAVPLAAAYFIILGLRLAFELPAGLPANWVYKLTLDQSNHDARTIARKMMLTFLVPGVFLPSLALGIAPAAMVVVLSLLLIEVVLLRFRKIPFTCTLPLLQNHALMLALIYVFGFFFFTSFASFERWMLVQPVRFAAAPVLFGGAWYALRWIQRDTPEIDTRLIYEEVPVQEVQKLNLTPV